mmetsp:Transcript_4566/g.8807  ORF Transcript_4566/g.8807 Transcript_4566/m.8807 type:complete len:209 (-) Transcript_4566:249-875(-)
MKNQMSNVASHTRTAEIMMITAGTAATADHSHPPSAMVKMAKENTTSPAIPCHVCTFSGTASSQAASLKDPKMHWTMMPMIVRMPNTACTDGNAKKCPTWILFTMMMTNPPSAKIPPQICQAACRLRSFGMGGGTASSLLSASMTSIRYDPIPYGKQRTNASVMKSGCILKSKSLLVASAVSHLSAVNQPGTLFSECQKPPSEALMKW